MTPEDAAALLRVIFSAAFGCVGIFMMIYLTIHAATLGPQTIAALIGGALGCATTVVAIRWPLAFQSPRSSDEDKK